jgi:glutathione synthase/RimK-type ligase-like ATP-grasp enzyme
LTGNPFPSSTRAGARVALVTCSEIPLLEADDRLVIAPLGALGVQAEPVVWDDASADWSSYDAVVLRSPWDYAARRDEFVAWAHAVKRLANPAAVVEWNTDKRYLASLRGIPVVPTTFVSPSDDWAPPPGEYVIKPAIGAGSVDTGRYGTADAGAATVHMRRLQADGRVAMVQPYLSAVDTYGETALLYFADPASGRLVFSHAIRKGPMLEGPDAGVEGLYKPEQIMPRVPSPEELDVGARVVAQLPTGLLYARIDLIPDAAGDPVLLELELTEPSLFLEYADGAAARFAASIAALVTG